MDTSSASEAEATENPGTRTLAGGGGEVVGGSGRGAVVGYRNLPAIEINLSNLINLGIVCEGHAN